MNAPLLAPSAGAAEMTAYVVLDDQVSLGTVQDRTWDDGHRTGPFPVWVVASAPDGVSIPGEFTSPYDAAMALLDAVAAHNEARASGVDLGLSEREQAVLEFERRWAMVRDGRRELALPRELPGLGVTAYRAVLHRLVANPRVQDVEPALVASLTRRLDADIAAVS